MLRILLASLILSATACGAQPSAPLEGTRDLAELAVESALALPAGLEREAVLRTVSRNLRYAHRDLALRSAQGMREDYERRSFEPKPSPLDEEIMQGLSDLNAQRREKERQCQALIRLGPPQRASVAELARRDEQARSCANLDAPPGCVPPWRPPFATLMAMARTLAASKTRAELIYMALWSTWDREPSQAKVALAELRALIPQLPPEEAAEAQGWLDDYKVDLLEGKPQDAVNRVRASSLSNKPHIDLDPATRASSLVADLLRLGYVDEAVGSLALLPVGPSCDRYDPGFGDLYNVALSNFDAEPLLARFLDRLPASPEFRRLCPKGLSKALEADLEIRAGRPNRGLIAAAGVANVSDKVQLQADAADNLVKAGRRDEARSLLVTAAEQFTMPVTDTASANLRLRLIHQLARVGERVRAEQLASGFPRLGTRAVAWSVIVGELDKRKAVDGWGGPEVTLPDG